MKIIFFQIKFVNVSIADIKWESKHRLFCLVDLGRLIKMSDTVKRLSKFKQETSWQKL